MMSLAKIMAYCQIKSMCAIHLIQGLIQRSMSIKCSFHNHERFNEILLIHRPIQHAIQQARLAFWGGDCITLAVTFGGADEYSVCSSLPMHGVISSLLVDAVLICINLKPHFSDIGQGGSYPTDEARCTCLFSLEDFQSMAAMLKTEATPRVIIKGARSICVWRGATLIKPVRPYGCPRNQFKLAAVRQ